MTAFKYKLKGNCFKALFGILLPFSRFSIFKMKKKSIRSIGLPIILLVDDLLNSHYHSA